MEIFAMWLDQDNDLCNMYDAQVWVIFFDIKYMVIKLIVLV